MVSSLRHTVFKNFGKIDYLLYFCKRGFSKRLCLTILDDNIFLKEFDLYN